MTVTDKEVLDAMPIQMILDGQRSKPAIFCDYCLKLIETAGDGNYHWSLDEQDAGRPAELCFTHKHCCHAFEKGRKPEVWGAEELRDLPIRIAVNLGLPVEAEPTEIDITYCLRGRIHDFDFV